MRKRGLTYIEILAGIAIICFVLFGMSAVFGIGIKNNRKAIKTAVASGLSQAKAEELRIMKFNEIEIGYAEDIVGDFTRKVTVTYVQENDFNKKSLVETNAKKIQVAVDETDIRGVEFSCVVSNPAMDFEIGI